MSIILAYVDGLPIPSDSSFFIILASVNLAGGLVTPSFVLTFSISNLSFSCMSGKSSVKISSSDFWYL